MFSWLSWLTARGASPREVAKTEAAIDPALWQQQVAALPFLRGLSADELATLRRHCAWFLASKTFHGAHGLQVDDAMALSIALQACLPILHLGTGWYEGWSGIVVYPGAFVTHSQEQDAAGIVHHNTDPTFGLTMEGGPLLLSWPQVKAVQEGQEGQEGQQGQQGPSGAAQTGGHSHDMNVVIHEFAHKLDMAHGEANGMPHLGGSGIAPAQWMETLGQAWRRFARAVDLLESAMPAGVNIDNLADSPEAQALYAGLPLDPYAASDEVEFFAVSSEAFFTEPERLRQWHPQWYALLAAFYRQDPGERLGVGR